MEEPAPEQLPLDEGENCNFGPEALKAIRDWDGGESSSLPEHVSATLLAIAHDMSEGLDAWIGSVEQPRRVRIPRKNPKKSADPKTYEALLQGWLREVNWQQGTARLYDYGGDYIPLRFEKSLGDDMRRLATQFVDVTGKGKFNANDDWISVQVEKISGFERPAKPFDMEAFRNNPNRKVFRREDMVTSSEPFDVDEFIRIIKEGRRGGGD